MRALGCLPPLPQDAIRLEEQLRSAREAWQTGAAEAQRRAVAQQAEQQAAWEEEKAALIAQATAAETMATQTITADKPTAVATDSAAPGSSEAMEQELSVLAEDDALWRGQLTELESELRRAQESLSARTDEAKQAQMECLRLRARVERLESAAIRERAAQSTSALNTRVEEGVAELEASRDRAEVQHQACQVKLSQAVEENTKLRERVRKLEKLKEKAKAAALEVESELLAKQETSAVEADKAARLLESAKRQREQLERRLEAAENAHERARMQLAAKDAELRAATTEADAAQRSAIVGDQANDVEGEAREGESDAAALRRLRQALARSRVEKTKAVQAGQREMVALQHEVQQLRLKLRGYTAAKASREHELEATIKRLSRRSQLHESVQELSDQLASAHAEVARQQVTIESLRMEKDHAQNEVCWHRPTLSKAVSCRA